MTPDWLLTASTWILPVLLAITLHEAAHGQVADWLGDDTARRMGRVSLNPIRHVDPVGTVMVPGLLVLASSPFLFGWAKPVPVRFDRLRRPRQDMVLVAAAGPASNLLMAAIAAFSLNVAALLPSPASAWASANLVNAVWINVLLAVFNMLPLPPLDGGRVAVGLLPHRLAWPLARLEPAGMPILIGCVFLLPWLAESLGLDFDPLHWLVLEPARFLAGLVLRSATPG